MWLLPSKNRPERLARLFKVFAETLVSTPGMILLHSDDDNDYSKVKLTDGWRFYRISEYTDSPGENVRLWMKDHFTDQKWLGLLTDDFIPLTPCWDKIVVDALDGTNIVSINDQWIAPSRMTGLGAFSGDWIRAIGYLFPPKIKWLYSDDIWELLGRKTGSWKILMNVLCEHEHGLKDKKFQDETFFKVMSFLDSDRMAFEEWKASPAYPEAVKAIKALQKSRR